MANKESCDELFLVSLAILFIAMMFEIAQDVVTSKLPITEKALFFSLCGASYLGFYGSTAFHSQN